FRSLSSTPTVYFSFLRKIPQRDRFSRARTSDFRTCPPTNRPGCRRTNANSPRRYPSHFRNPKPPNTLSEVLFIGYPIILDSGETGVGGWGSACRATLKIPHRGSSRASACHPLSPTLAHATQGRICYRLGRLIPCRSGLNT